MHLGVTEAGEGEDGRMKSAIGIGSLLADGLGVSQAHSSVMSSVMSSFLSRQQLSWLTMLMNSKEK